MGNFYVNFTLRGPSQQTIAATLAGRAAIVTPERDGSVVVFDEESDGQNQEIITKLASWLSHELFCPVLAVLNHDDDILWYQLHVKGGLVDEYDSTPGYFNTVDEAAAMVEPTGGNAQKLCDAFGAGDVAGVERILRKIDYSFAFERHAELVEVLGIPSFGVGAGFRYFSAGETPEGLEGKDLLWTGDLTRAQLISQSEQGIVPKPIPGYYRANTRAIAQSSLLLKSTPVGWMPGLWAELECSERDLSAGFLRATAAHREQFKQLGFTEVGFKNVTRVLNPNHRDRGSVNYLGGSRCHFGQLLYHKDYIRKLKAEEEGLLISFTAVFKDGTLACTNNIKTALGTLPSHKVVRVESNDVACIYESFLHRLDQRREKPRYFADLGSLKRWFDANQIELFEDRVRRGLFVRMSDEEVAVARSQLPAGHGDA